MSTSLLEQIFAILLEKTIDLKITGGNETLWGFGLVSTGLLYHFKTISIYEINKNDANLAKEQKHIEHDIGIFSKANEIMSGDFLSEFLSQLRSDHSYINQKGQKVDEFCYFLGRDENQFLSSELSLAAKEFWESNLKLDSFLGLKFYLYPENQNGENLRFCMAPWLNIDRGGFDTPEQLEEYEKFKVELESLTIDLREKYRNFRGEIKSILLI